MERMKKKDEKRIKKVGFFLLFIGVFVLLLLWPYEYVPQEIVKNQTVLTKKLPLYLITVVRYPSEIEIVKGNLTSNLYLGISTETNRLNFGKIPENLTVRKYISLTNQENVKVLVKVKVFGNISKIITPSVEKIILGPGENFQVEITANTTNRCPGFYDGEIDIVVKKPLISYLSFF